MFSKLYSSPGYELWGGFLRTRVFEMKETHGGSVTFSGTWFLQRWNTGGSMLVSEVKVKYLTITHCFSILQGWLISGDIFALVFHQSKLLKTDQNNLCSISLPFSSLKSRSVLAFSVSFAFLMTRTLPWCTCLISVPCGVWAQTSFLGGPCLLSFYMWLLD